MSESSHNKEIWDAARGELQRINGYSNAMMRLWFDVMELVLLTDTTAVFNVSSNFKCQHLKLKYAPAIKTALTSVLGYDVEVDIRSTEDQDNEVERSMTFEALNRTAEALYRSDDVLKEQERLNFPDDFDDSEFDNSDDSDIQIRDHDELIDLSPCIGLYQMASYFKKYDILP